MSHAQVVLLVLGLVLTVAGSVLAVTAAVRDWRRFRASEPIVIPRRLRDWWRHTVTRTPRPRSRIYGMSGTGIGYVDFTAAERTASDDGDLGRRVDALVQIARELEARYRRAPCGDRLLDRNRQGSRCPASLDRGRRDEFGAARTGRRRARRPRCLPIDRVELALGLTATRASAGR
ncbi:hypothetical protein [Cellulomonas persica]|uniref:Uncharacterized protein n=1 Tax=Cellulomonas persica TaxID=76861 RepID=A0A510UQB8_9CELL|nr:hypothetical protein [Cellulomonas persica]GEK16864.1 hypothetical protein CPE01_05970 [Cellulomonas persica]